MWCQNRSRRPTAAAAAAAVAAAAPEGALCLASSDGEMRLYPGLPLSGALPGRKAGICNGAFYRCVTISDSVVVRCEASGAEISLSADFVRAHMRLTHALTQASIQGSSLAGRVRVYTKSPRFTLRHLFVCMSRCTCHITIRAEHTARQ